MGLGSFVPTHGCATRAFRGKRVSGAVNQGVSHETCDGIHAKDEDRHRPFPAPAFDLSDPIEQRQKEETDPAAKQDKGTGPQILVDREPAIPDFAGEYSE